MRHRGAIAADGHTGDGAGVLMPLPRAPLAGPVVRARDGLPPRRARPRSCRSRMRGGRHRPRGLAHGSDRAAGSRRRGTPLDAADRTARPAPAARAVARRGRGLRLPRSTPRGRDTRRLRGVALVSNRHLQGALRRRPARCVLRRPPRPGARRAVRDLPPALLDEYIARRGSAPSPSASSATTARSTRSTATRPGCAVAGTTSRRTAPTRRCSTTRSSCSCAGAGTCGMRWRC